MDAERLTPDEAAELARAALDTTLGECLIASELAMLTMTRGVTDAITAAGRGEAIAEAPDGGNAMAAAVLGDLPPPERGRLVKSARERAERRCFAATLQLVLGCRVVLQADENLIEPGTVAMVAAMPFLDLMPNPGATDAGVES